MEGVCFVTKEIIQPKGLPTPTTYSHVVKSGNTLYLAGQVAQDESGNVVGRGDITAQAEQVFQNIQKCLAAAGATFADVVKIQVFVTDHRFREAVGQVRQKYITAPYPASTFLVVSGLAAPEFLLEIEAVAVVG
jgi:reactive intermediate/imine deaminase